MSKDSQLKDIAERQAVWIEGYIQGVADARNTGKAEKELPKAVEDALLELITEWFWPERPPVNGVAINAMPSEVYPQARLHLKDWMRSPKAKILLALFAKRAISASPITVHVTTNPNADAATAAALGHAISGAIDMARAEARSKDIE